MVKFLHTAVPLLIIGSLATLAITQDFVDEGTPSVQFVATDQLVEVVPVHVVVVGAFIVDEVPNVTGAGVEDEIE
jgi:hypothetical protein